MLLTVLKIAFKTEDTTPRIALNTLDTTLWIVLNTLDTTDVIPFHTVENMLAITDNIALIVPLTADHTVVIIETILLIEFATSVSMACHIVTNTFFKVSKIGEINPTIAFHISLIVLEIDSSAVETAFFMNSHAAVIYSLQFSHMNIHGIVEKAACLKWYLSIS